MNQFMAGIPAPASGGGDRPPATVASTTLASIHPQPGPPTPIPCKPPGANRVWRASPVAMPATRTRRPEGRRVAYVRGEADRTKGNDIPAPDREGRTSGAGNARHWHER